MNRIDQKFNDLKQSKKKAFVAFITAGDPNLSTTVDLVIAFEKAGVDIIELGVPFSDPMADGATIQAASERALKNGTNLSKIFDAVKKIRLASSIPIALMTYYNPVYAYGDKAFIAKCKEVGVDGVIIPDLPPEEAGELRRAALANEISTVFFVAPTTTDARVKQNAQAATGFIYYVSLTGVTGVKQALPTDVIKDIARIKKITQKPICAGFGINDAKQARAIAAHADGVIVGSAIIKQIQAFAGKKNLVKEVSLFVSQLVKAVK